MKAKSFAGMRCSIAGALDQIGDRWALLVVRDLALGKERFEDLRASTDIPPATLAARLKHLESTGIVERHRYQDRPARDAYRLTAKGRDLWKVEVALREWGDRWDATGLGAPAVVAVDEVTGNPLALALVDTVTNEVVSPDRFRLRETGEPPPPDPGSESP